ncbi:hypothetical protein [Streptomyces sp. NPDC007991]|uniref:hypothetical protein n=1 Tax=Streptomyces sp. NPDC007991 TaxID=3364803 RepID=UPI0036DFF3AE
MSSPAALPASARPALRADAPGPSADRSAPVQQAARPTPRAPAAYTAPAPAPTSDLTKPEDLR